MTVFSSAVALTVTVCFVPQLLVVKLRVVCSSAITPSVSTLTPLPMPLTVTVTPSVGSVANFTV